MAFFITNIVFVFFALTYQEYWRPGCMRQRLGGVLILACLSSWLGMVYSVDGDLDQPLGQYGHLGFISHKPHSRSFGLHSGASNAKSFSLVYRSVAPIA